MKIDVWILPERWVNCHAVRVELVFDSPIPPSPGIINWLTMRDRERWTCIHPIYDLSLDRNRNEDRHIAYRIRLAAMEFVRERKLRSIYHNQISCLMDQFPELLAIAIEAFHHRDDI